ncbi:MAG: lasso RiPP family leader peptide-containing protein [Egibacteraceae bacterium]
MEQQQGAVYEPPMLVEVGDFAGWTRGRYLQAAQPPASSVEQALVDADQSLWDLVSSPLMLNIVTQVYRERRADTLLAPGTLEERRERLVAEYVDLERGTVTGRYTEAKTKRWLSWLARAMCTRGQSEFDLDRLQPDWLPTAAQRRLVTVIPAIVSCVVGGVGVGLVFRWVYARVVEWVAGLDARLVTGLSLDPDVAGLVFGSVAGLVFALVAVIGGRAAEPVRALRWPWVGWGGGLGTGLVVGLVAGPMAGLVAGLVALVVVGLVALGGGRVYELVRGDGLEGARPAINPVEELKWSPKGLANGLRVGLASGLRYYGLRIGLIGLSFALSGLLGGLLGGELSGEEIIGLLGRLDDVLVSVLGFGLVVGLGVGLAVGLVNGLVNGMVAGLAEQHVEPNEGIRRSRRHAVRIGLSVGLIVGLISGLVYVLAYVLRGSLGVGLVFGPRLGLAYGLVYGLGAGLVYGLGFGLEFGGIAYLRHLALRALLVWNRAAPWHYMRFLDNATARRLLRRSGGSYSFADRFLLGYFAAEDDQ